MAFGKLFGGDGLPTHYLLPSGFVAFHGRFLRSLVDGSPVGDHPDGPGRVSWGPMLAFRA